ncbi:MAG: hypothetical protein ACTSVY_02530, partial [Candidatus Helarchaeota archaeon]
GSYSMSPLTPSDTYYLDGANYTISLQFDVGNYEYYFETNDSKFMTRYPSSSNFTDLIITEAETHYFDGLYIDYYIAMYMGAWGSMEISYSSLSPTTYNCSVHDIYYYNQYFITDYWYVVDNGTREVLQASANSPVKVGKKDTNLIHDNARIGTNTEMDGENKLYGYYECTNEVVYNILGEDHDCWSFYENSGPFYYDKQTGLLLRDYSNVGMGYSIHKYITATNMNFQVEVPPDIDLLSPLNDTYTSKYIPIVVQNNSIVDQVWIRNWTGSDWSDNESLIYNNTHWVNSSFQVWNYEYEQVQVFANDSNGLITQLDVGFTVEEPPSIELLSPINKAYTTNSVPIIVLNNTILNEVWVRNWNGSDWSDNATLAYNNTHWVNSSIQTWENNIEQLQVFANDSVGEITELNVTFTIDTELPTISIDIPSINDAILKGSTIQIEGYANGTGSNIDQLYINGSFTLTQDPRNTREGAYTFTNSTFLQCGFYCVNVTIVDEVGFIQSIIRTFYIDNILPEINCTSLRYQGDAQNGNEIHFSGFANGTVSTILNLTINDSNFDLTNDPRGSFAGNYKFLNNSPISEGPLSVSINITDDSNQSYIFNITCIVDFSSPTQPTNLNHSFFGLDGVNITWDAVTDITNVTYIIYRNGLNIENVTINQFSETRLALGVYNYTIQAIDNAGNLGPTAEIIIEITGSGSNPSGSPPIIFLIIMLSIIGSIIGAGAIVLTVKRRSGKRETKKKIIPKMKVVQETSPLAQKLKEIEIMIGLEDIGLGIIQDITIEENFFDIEKNMIVIKNLDNFSIGLQRVNAEITLKLLDKDSIDENLKKLTEFVSSLIPEFNNYYNINTLRMFLDIYKDNSICNWLVKNNVFNLGVYENYISIKIFELYKKLKELKQKTEQQFIHIYIFSILIAEFLAHYENVLKKEFIIPELVNKDSLIFKIHKEFKSIFSKNQNVLPNTAECVYFLEILGGMFLKYMQE